MKQPVVDIGDCSLCMSCVQVCPEVFNLNEAAGYIEVIDLDDYPEDCVQEAMKYCPEDVIKWQEEN